MSAPVAAVVVAGGTGERFGSSGGKQLAVVAGRPVLSWSLRAIAAVPAIGRIVVVCHPDRVEEYRSAAVEPLSLDCEVVLVGGGDTRQRSVAAGLAALGAGDTVVVVHDGARPLVTPDVIASALDAFDVPGVDGVVVGHESVDTLKTVERGVVTGTPDRTRYWAVQTPQVFRLDALRRAHEAALSEGFTGTDDASLVERSGGLVRVVEGRRDNIKVTMPEDLAFAESVLVARGETA